MVDTGSIVSALGGGSGIDMTKLAADLATAQFQLRQDRLDARSQTLDRQISAASSIRNAMSTLASSLGERVRAGDLAIAARVADPSIAQATLATGAAPSGSFSLEVTALARGQVLASPPLADAAPVGEGTLTIRFGEVRGGMLLENPDRPPLGIAVAPGDTLADIAAAINRADSGLTAYVAASEQGARLVIKGQDGVRNGFAVAAEPAVAGRPLAELAWAPDAAADPARLTQSAGDAQFLLDGVAMTSRANTTGVLGPGLSLELNAVNTGRPTRIAFSNPTEIIPQVMGDLVTAFNEVVGQVRDATRPDGGELATDPGARVLKSRLSRLATDPVMPAAADGAPRTMGDLGLKLGRDGSFSFDAARLAQTMQRDPAGVAAMFTTGIHGIYASIDKLARSTARASDPGSLAGSVVRFTSISKTLADSREQLADKQEALRLQLIGRLVKADTRVASSQSTLSFLKAQIASWNPGRE